MSRSSSNKVSGGESLPRNKACSKCRASLLRLASPVSGSCSERCWMRAWASTSSVISLAVPRKPMALPSRQIARADIRQ
ncbi:hypothetical protein [Pseudomonas sp. NBRC 111139]|uniref:hypothetical protein n=1 Tax=Pseudomonas sp. NBRC 111139 TaxID=1661054 RepID=UPI0035D495C7